MALRSIVCLHNGFDFEASALATAIELAKTHKAHLRILHASYLTRPYSGLYGETVLAGTGWQDMLDKQIEQQREEARQSAEALCNKFGLPMQSGAGNARPRAEFVALQNVYNSTLVRDLSVSDLIIVGAEKGASEVVGQSTTDLALFATGRPVLIVHPAAGGAPAAMTDATAALAWNDSSEAVHALVHASSVYSTAKVVYLCVTKEPHMTVPTDDQRLALDYLAAHDIEARLELIERGHRSAADAVLARVNELGCSYLVMGAYGHNVFREMMFGGFSDTMLAKADLPLVLCH